MHLKIHEYTGEYFFFGNAYLVSDYTVTMNSFLQKKTVKNFRGWFFNYKKVLDMIN